MRPAAMHEPGIFARRLPHLVIERVSPMLDGGRYPVKRLLGSEIEVSANIFKDGHDLLAARILFRPESETVWHEAPLDYQFDPDRWHGSFRADRLGRWQFTIEAWSDRYGTWVSDLDKRLKVGQDVRAELLEGAYLLELRTKNLSPEAAARIHAAARVLGDGSKPIEDRLTVAFSAEVRQTIYGPIDDSEALSFDPILEVIVDRERAVYGTWYELFPRSQTTDPARHGTFADVERRLPDIASMGFDVVYLPPIHPIGFTHRKGKNNSTVAQPGDLGSPWAIGSKEGGHDAILSELGTVDDFRSMVRAAREVGIEIALDYALQCSPDHPWVDEHPEWFYIRADGSIRYAENPPKKYEDIYPLNFWCGDREGLWNACRDVLLYWAEQGVKIFRVDNPHTKPFAFWEWAIAQVSREHPDTIFLAEAFTRPNRMRTLGKIGFNQSYTYFTWKNNAVELREYLTELTQTQMVEYYRPNLFANTPDILHAFLQEGGRPAFRLRLVLAATLAPTYGIYSGYELCENKAREANSEEYLDSEKYEIRVRDWDAPGNIKSDITLLNRVRRENPALHVLGNLQFLHTETDHILAYRKYAPGNELIIVVNLDPREPHDTMVHVPIAELMIAENQPYQVEDLLTSERFIWRGVKNYVRLDPTQRVAHVLKIVR